MTDYLRIKTPANFIHIVHPGLMAGIKALGLEYTFAEARIGTIGNRPPLFTRREDEDEGWVLSVLDTVDVIGCSGSSPNALKGMSAKQLGDFYGLAPEGEDALRKLLQQTRQRSSARHRLYYFLDCVLYRQKHRARIRSEQRTPISKLPILFLFATPFFLGLTVIDFSIFFLVLTAGMPAYQSLPLLIALLILPLFLIRPTVNLLFRTPYGLALRYWYHRGR